MTRLIPRSSTAGFLKNRKKQRAESGERRAGRWTQSGRDSPEARRGLIGVVPVESNTRSAVSQESHGHFASEAGGAQSA